MTTTYGTVVFDFGGVFTGSPFVTLARAVTERGVDVDAGLREVFGDYSRDTDHPWHRLERGEITFLAARERDHGVEPDDGRCRAGPDRAVRRLHR